MSPFWAGSVNFESLIDSPAERIVLEITSAYVFLQSSRCYSTVCKTVIETVGFSFPICWNDKKIVTVATILDSVACYIKKTHQSLFFLLKCATSQREEQRLWGNKSVATLGRCFVPAEGEGVHFASMVCGVQAKSSSRRFRDVRNWAVSGSMTCEK